MHRRHVLIIDDDEIVGGLYLSTLSSIDPDLDITIAPDTEAAMRSLASGQFDLIITDFAFLEQNDGQIYSIIQNKQPPECKLLVSAFASTELSQRTSRFQIPYLIYKPIDLTLLNHTLVEIFNSATKMRVDQFSLTEGLYQQINRELTGLRESTNARCILVSDTFGRVLVTIGDTEGIPTDAITSLLGGGIATILEAGQSLDDGGQINLAYREGKKSDLYAVNIGSKLLLILVIDRGLFYNRLGTVWFYTRQTVINLNKIIQEPETGKPGPKMGENLPQAYQAELDRLFKDNQ